LAGKDRGLKLLGTIVSPKAELSYAVIDWSGPAGQGIYRTRDMVAQTKIVAILRNQVVVETETGERLRLSVDEEPPTGGTPKSRPVFGPAVAFQGIPSSQNEPIYQVPIADVVSSFSEPKTVIEQTIASPHLSEGRPDGFYLGRLRAADVLYRIGLRTGDVVKGVDGMAFEGPQDAERFLSRLSQGGRMELQISRRGQDRKVDVIVN
jgi:type II secretion system protein C